MVVNNQFLDVLCQLHNCVDTSHYQVIFTVVNLIYFILKNSALSWCCFSYLVLPLASYFAEKIVLSFSVLES